MNIQFDIPDAKVQDLSTNAIAELTRHCKAISEQIVDEAARIEAARRLSNTNTEITAAIVNEAALFSKRLPLHKKKKWWIKLIQIMTFLSSLIAGGLFDIDKFNSLNYVMWFIVSLLVATGLTVFLISNNESNGI